MNTEITLPKILLPTDLEQAVRVQARAFRDDPLWVYVLPDVKQREKLMPTFFKVFFKAWISNQQAFGVSQPLEGVAVWSKPDQKELDFFKLLNAGFPKLLFSPILPSFFKTFRIFAKFEEMQKKYAPDPHYYLNTISVAPEAQGKGLASKLIKPFLAQADLESVSTYTETMTPSNVSLYEYYGFKCMEQYNVPKTDLSIWSFYRPANT